MNSLDELCLEHDWCLRRAERACVPWPATLVTYDYDFEEEIVKPSGSLKEYSRVTVGSIKKAYSWTYILNVNLIPIFYLIMY